MNLQNNVFTIGGGSSTTFSGAIIGTGGSLVKTGSATLTLSGVNTFTAGVTLNQGTIQLGNNQAFGIGALLMSGGRVSSDSGTARSLSNALTLSGTIGFGSVANAGTLTMGGAVTLASNVALTVDSAVALNGVVSGALDSTRPGPASSRWLE